MLYVHVTVSLREADLSKITNEPCRLVVSAVVISYEFGK